MLEAFTRRLALVILRVKKTNLGLKCVTTAKTTRISLCLYLIMLTRYIMKTVMLCLQV